MSWVSAILKKYDKQQEEKVIMINYIQVVMLQTISSNEEKLKNCIILSAAWPA